MSLAEMIAWIDTIPSSTLLVGMIIVGAVIGWCLSNRKSIKDLWDTWYQTRKRKDELLKMILEDHSRIENYEDNRVHDRKQSFNIQQQLVTANTKLAEQIEKLSAMVEENQRKTDERFSETEEKNNKRIRAELKDKIRRSYQVYHERGYWNDMEKEALEDLLEEYESHGGHNSFCHTIVLPEMYTWEIRPFE